MTDAKITPYPEPDAFLQFLPRSMHPKFGYPPPHELESGEGEPEWQAQRHERKEFHRSASRQRKAQNRARSQSRRADNRAPSQQQKRQREESQPRTGKQAKNRQNLSQSQTRFSQPNNPIVAGRGNQAKKARSEPQQNPQPRRSRPRNRRASRKSAPTQASGGSSRPESRVDDFARKSSQAQSSAPISGTPAPKRSTHSSCTRSEGELSGSDEETPVMQPVGKPSSSILKSSKSSDVEKPVFSQMKPSFPSPNQAQKLDELADQLATTTLAKHPTHASGLTEQEVEDALLVPLPDDSQNVDMSAAEDLLKSPTRQRSGENPEDSGHKTPESSQKSQASSKTPVQSVDFGSTDVRLLTGELIRLSDGSTVNNPHWVPPKEPIVKPKDPNRPRQRGKSQTRVQFSVPDPTPAQSAAVREEFVMDWDLLKTMDVPSVPRLEQPYGRYAQTLVTKSELDIHFMGDLRFSEKLKDCKALKYRFFMSTVPEPGMYLLVNGKSKACAYVVVTLSVSHPEAIQYPEIANQYNPNNWCVVSDALEVRDEGLFQSRFLSISYPPLLGDYWLVRTPVNEREKPGRFLIRELPRIFGSALPVRYKPSAK